MKHLIAIALAVLFACSAAAQQCLPEPQQGKRQPGRSLMLDDGPRFSPEEFRQKQESYIKRHAELTESEAKLYLPLLHEMHEKQRQISDERRELKRSINKESKAEQAEQAIMRIAALQEKEASIRTAYLKKMCATISPIKVMAALKAEDKFHREIFRQSGAHKAQNNGRHGKNGHQQKKP